MEISDTKRRLLERWYDARYVKPALRKINIRGGTGLRCLNNLEIEFRYPIVAIAGENGTGKSTILACSACAYHGDKNFVPNGVDPARPYYTFGDFFIFSSLDPRPKNPQVTWYYSGQEYPAEHTAIRKSKWSHYDLRPVRPVQFVGIARALPARERNVLRSHFTKSSTLRGRKYSDEERERIGRILGHRYSTAARGVSGSYSLHVAKSRTFYSGFNMGAGEDSVFELAEIMYKLPEGALLIIEEIETGLHPAAQVRLMDEMHELVSSKHIQVILTTHSFDILKAVPEKGRIFLKRTSAGIVPLYEISPSYAFSLMSTLSIPELTIYVEDKVAQILVNNCLPFSLRSRCRTLEIGSIEALAGQITAARRDPHLGEVLGIYDGDKSEVEFTNAFSRQLQKNLSEEDLKWLRDHTISLPGNCAPEKWIQNLFTDADLIKNVADLMQAGPHEIEPILSTISPLEHHNLFYELSNRFGRTVDEIKNIIAMALSRTFPEEFEAIVAVVDFVVNLVIDRTFDGYQSEIQTIYGQLQKILDVKIEPAPDEWDRGYNVDFFIRIKNKYIGLQIKPAGYAYIPQIINEFEFQKRTHQKFTEKFGGKVFYIISIKKDKGKVIHNPEVIEEIRKEIKRLEKD